MFWPLLSPHFPVMWRALPWKPYQGEVIWLPMGSRRRSLEAEIPHRPSLCSQVGCSNPSLSPKQPTHQTTKPQLLFLHDAWAKSEAFPPIARPEGSSAHTEHGSSHLRAVGALWEAGEKTNVRPSSTWGRARRLAVPCHPCWPGASKQSKGGPELLTKPTLFPCAFLLAVLDVGELISRPLKGQRGPALPKGALAPINTAPWTRKEWFANN